MLRSMKPSGKLRTSEMSPQLSVDTVGELFCLLCRDLTVHENRGERKICTGTGGDTFDLILLIMTRELLSSLYLYNRKQDRIRMY